MGGSGREASAAGGALTTAAWPLPPSRLLGARLPSTRLAFPTLPRCAAPVGIGLFAEDREQPAVNIFKRVEQKKLLSSVEKLGLLSKARLAASLLHAARV